MPGWVRATLRFRRVVPPLGSSIRGGLCVGVPVAVGFAVGEPVIGVTLGLACVLRTIGEREGPHRGNVTSLLIATPIAAAGYLFGLVQDLALVPLVALMAAVAFVAGTLARHGEGFALGGMQFLLVASIALGVPDTGTAAELGWFFLGAGIYAVCMAVDFLLLEPLRPERIALADLDRAVQMFEASPGPVERAAANSALAAARRVPTPGWATTTAGIARWGRYADVVTAADDLVAWEAARRDPDDARRRAYRDARAALLDGPPSDRAPVPVTPVTPVASVTSVAGPSWRERLALDPPTRAHAARLALCFGLAVSSRAWVGLDHWFWVPATVGLVMQPDFGSVFGRAVLRVAGTLVGSAFAALVIWAVPSGIGLGIVIGMLAATVPWAKQTSYVLQSLVLAAVVLLLVSQVAPAEGSLSLPLQRVLATAVGGVIVLVFGYLVWPAARRVSIAPTVRSATSSMAAMLRTATEPVPTDPEAQAARKASAISARQRALDLLVSTKVPLGRAAGEPPPTSTDAAAWTDAVRSLERLGGAVSDHAIARLSGTPPLPGADAIAAEIEAVAYEPDPDVVETRASDLAARISGR